MKTFREWLRETGKEKVETIKEHDYYTEEQMIKDIEMYDSVQRMITGHNLGLELKHNVNWTRDMIKMNENVIEPLKIKIHTSNLEKLNSEWNEYNIFFIESQYLAGQYDKQKDEITIFCNSKNTELEIEAMVAYEMVHKEQHKRAGENYFKQSEKMVNEINSIIREKQNLIRQPAGNLIHRDKLKELDKKLLDKETTYRYLTPYEEMAYACQNVVMYSKNFSKPNELINFLKTETEFPITSRFKKCVAMYWLIKDKI